MTLWGLAPTHAAEAAPALESPLPKGPAQPTQPPAASKTACLASNSHCPAQVPKDAWTHLELALLNDLAGHRLARQLVQRPAHRAEAALAQHGAQHVACRQARGQRVGRVACARWAAHEDDRWRSGTAALACVELRCHSATCHPWYCRTQPCLWPLLTRHHVVGIREAAARFGKVLGKIARVSWGRRRCSNRLQTQSGKTSSRKLACHPVSEASRAFAQRKSTLVSAGDLRNASSFEAAAPSVSTPHLGHARRD